MPKTSDAVEHLWIIVAEIDAANGKAICVFVAHPSVIYYKDARELDVKLVETAITSGIKKFVCKAHDLCSPELLKRVQEGLVKSKDTPKGIKATCKTLWGST